MNEYYYVTIIYIVIRQELVAPRYKEWNRTCDYYERNSISVLSRFPLLPSKSTGLLRTIICPTYAMRTYPTDSILPRITPIIDACLVQKITFLDRQILRSLFLCDKFMAFD